eukprot:4404767-Prymnesium_polylepis.1
MRAQALLRRLAVARSHSVDADTCVLLLPNPSATDAWPLGQDVCKLIKQRCREICPSLRVPLDVENLVTGGGTKEVNHSRCILVFARPVYFEKINCVKEMTRTIVRNKQITPLLPDAEVHGEFTQAMIGDIVTDEWVKKWKIEAIVAKWAGEWGVADLKPPMAKEICESLFHHSRRSSGRASRPSRTARWCSCPSGCCPRGSATSICRARRASSFPSATVPSRSTAARTTTWGRKRARRGAQ